MSDLDRDSERDGERVLESGELVAEREVDKEAESVREAVTDRPRVGDASLEGERDVEGEREAVEATDGDSVGENSVRGHAMPAPVPFARKLHW